MHTIVITEPMALTDTQLAELKSLGNVIYHSSRARSTDEWLEWVKDADIIYTGGQGWEKGWKQLKNKYVTYIFVTAAFLYIDVLKQNNVLVSNSPGSNKVAVAEWITAMLLNYLRQ